MLAIDIGQKCIYRGEHLSRRTGAECVVVGYWQEDRKTDVAYPYYVMFNGNTTRSLVEDALEPIMNNANLLLLCP